APTGRHPGVDLDAAGALVEADRGPIGPGSERVADIAGRQGVQGAGDLGMLVAADLGITPERDVVGHGRSRPEHRLLDGLEVLARPLERAAVATPAVVLEAPVEGVGPGRVEIHQGLAAEAVLAHAGDGA